MKDGRQYSGELLGARGDRLVFRVEFGPGATVVRTFSLSAVDHVDPGDTPVTAAVPDKRVAPGPAEIRQMLREAWELLDEGDHEAALAALQRAVTQAEDDLLEELNRDALAARGTPLDELLAELRVHSATRPRNGSLFHLPFATRYEAAALGRRLQALADELRARLYQGRSLSEWVAEPKSYDSLTPDAPLMVRDIRLAAAALSARLRHDPSVRATDRRRAQLVAEHDRLTALAARIRALPGYTALPMPGAAENDDPTAAASMRLAARAAEERTASQPAKPFGMSDDADEPRQQDDE